MKRTTLLAFACALFAGQSALAQENKQEIVYVEDPAQGYLFNQFKDNWFITAEGGASLYFSDFDSERKLLDRFAPAASIYVGKWFSPIIGLRLGVNFLSSKGVTDTYGSGVFVDDPLVAGKYYKQKFNHFGPVGDVMLNLTNWWCGYRPGRVYNAVFYAGTGGYWTYVPGYKTTSNGYKRDGWVNGHDFTIPFRAGLINQFNVSEQVQLSLDIRWSAFEQGLDQGGEMSHDLQAYVGLTYLFKKREWKAPVVPVCPEPENCDALRARLAAADARIADLETQLRDCLNRPVETVVECNAPLTTIYYPINVTKLTSRDNNVLKAIASVMKDNSDKKYVLTGWADNFTGTEKVNDRIRKGRVEGVKKQLVKFGVPESQLMVTTNPNNLSDLGEKCVALDRAVTIEEAK